MNTGRSGCCCAVFVEYDFETGRTDTSRCQVHHCCPIHGGRDVRPATR